MTKLTKDKKLSSLHQQLQNALVDGTPSEDFKELFEQYVQELMKD